MKQKYIKKLFIITGSALFIILNSCESPQDINEETARKMIIHRNLGLAYLEESRFNDAADEFKMLVNIFPEEPLGYANLGFTYMHMPGKLNQAEKWLLDAIQLAPNHSDMAFLLAKVYELTSREKQATKRLETTLKAEPNHIRSLYQLALYYSKKSDKKVREKAIKYLGEVVNTLPANLVARLRLIELLLLDGKSIDAVYEVEFLRQVLPGLPEDSKKILQKALDLMNNDNSEKAYTYIVMFHNVMKPTSTYGASLTRLRGSNGPIAGEPIYRFSHAIPSPKKKGIPEGIRFTDVTDGSGLSRVSMNSVENDNTPPTIMAMGDADGDGDEDIFISQWLSSKGFSRQGLIFNNNGTFSDFSDKVGIFHPGRDLSAQFVDVDNDGYLDMFIINRISNRLYHNNGDGTFQDVSIRAGLGLNQGSQKAIFADLDLEGDLDIFIATVSHNILFRNNFDGTFTDISKSAGIRGEETESTDVNVGDFDDDGDMEIFVVNRNGENRYYNNLRQGLFRDMTTQSGLASISGGGSSALGDYNNDGFLDLFITDDSGKHFSLMRNRGDGTFELEVNSNNAFKKITGFKGLDAEFFDGDNDGFLDLLVAGKPMGETQTMTGLHLFYNNGAGQYLPTESFLPKQIPAANQIITTDFDTDGDLDILYTAFNGDVHLLRNNGGNLNHHLSVRLSGLRTGSTKNNHFGIGAKVEVKAGDLYQMRTMNKPIAHFGLGSRKGADILRVVWSNGVPQNNFNPKSNQTIVEKQILKGSCPWLFTWNGEKFIFATDVLWASALGMPLGIMAGETLYAFPNSANEYFKLPKNSLRRKDGKYLLQFTTQLWETPYLDQVKLMVIDHPDSVDIFLDETFTPPPFPPFRIYTVNDKRFPISAYDGMENDVLNKIKYTDGNYVSNFSPDVFQGIMELHDLVLDLGDVSKADSLYLFLYGWLFPTDAGINVNISQSKKHRIIFPHLQIKNKDGNWQTVIENIGFPKGKNKMMIVNLTDKFLTNDYRIRIRTNMQIYWDQIFFSTNILNESMHINDLNPIHAHLHFKGFSALTKKSPYSPEIPNYQTINSKPKWRDLTGFYTKYGNVLPLILESDSKYVIMNAGDEISLEFDANNVHSLPAGWSRDFIFFNNGWLKDGDLNTAHGQTVNPLPFHGLTSYPYGADDTYPSDREHTNYMKKYNTREITTESFKEMLRKKNN